MSSSSSLLPGQLGVERVAKAADPPQDAGDWAWIRDACFRGQQSGGSAGVAKPALTVVVNGYKIPDQRADRDFYLAEVDGLLRPAAPLAIMSRRGGTEPAAEVGMWRRITALPRAARLYADVHMARRREARTLAAAGEVACDVPGLGTEVARALADATALRKRRDAARHAAAASLEADRADWADAPGWLKLAIVARGLLVRGVLRAQRRRIERELAPLLRVIGADAMATPTVAAILSDHVRTGVEQERARAERAAAERARLLAPFGGRALPPSIGTGLRELARATLGLGRELRSRLVPRLPGLVGLAAGWWVAHAFTASRWADFTERLGLRRGGPWVVSGETYERLEFWVPLVAAALCAYLGSRFWRSLERRYTASAPGRPSEDVRQRPSPSIPREARRDERLE